MTSPHVGEKNMRGQPAVWSAWFWRGDAVSELAEVLAALRSESPGIFSLCTIDPCDVFNEDATNRASGVPMDCWLGFPTSTQSTSSPESCEGMAAWAFGWTTR